MLLLQRGSLSEPPKTHLHINCSLLKTCTVCVLISHMSHSIASKLYIRKKAPFHKFERFAFLKLLMASRDYLANSPAGRQIHVHDCAGPRKHFLQQQC